MLGRATDDLGVAVQADRLLGGRHQVVLVADERRAGRDLGLLNRASLDVLARLAVAIRAMNAQMRFAQRVFQRGVAARAILAGDEVALLVGTVAQRRAAVMSELSEGRGRHEMAHRHEPGPDQEQEAPQDPEMQRVFGEHRGSSCRGGAAHPPAPGTMPHASCNLPATAAKVACVQRLDPLDQWTWRRAAGFAAPDCRNFGAFGTRHGPCPTFGTDADLLRMFSRSPSHAASSQSAPNGAGQGLAAGHARHGANTSSGVA